MKHTFPSITRHCSTCSKECYDDVFDGMIPQNFQKLGKVSIVITQLTEYSSQ